MTVAWFGQAAMVRKPASAWAGLMSPALLETSLATSAATCNVLPFLLWFSRLDHAPFERFVTAEPMPVGNGPSKHSSQGVETTVP